MEKGEQRAARDKEEADHSKQGEDRAQEPHSAAGGGEEGGGGGGDEVGERGGDGRCA